MSSDDKPVTVSAIYLVWLAGLVLGFLLGMAVLAFYGESWREDAIRHGAAHYDLNTAAFTWNVPENQK